MRKRIKTRKIVKYYYYEEQEVDKKKVAYLLFLLLLTGILLTTSTYAWFTTNRVVSVNTLNVKVQTEGSLEISVDGTTWKPGVNQDEIIAAHSTNYPNSINQLPTFIEPVSTDGSLDGMGLIQMYLGEVKSNTNGDYIITSTKNVETESNGDNSEGKFVAFDIFFKTTEDKDLYLTNESKITYNGNVSTGTENAMRVAFVVEGNTTSGDSLSSIQNLRTNDINNVYIWEPNYDTHTKNGVTHARDVYGINTSLTGAARINYDGIISEITEDDNITLTNAKASSYPSKFATVTPRIITPTGNGSYQLLFNLKAGITKMRIYLWLEGQDVDCENNASVGNLAFNLQFSTNPS